MALDLTNNTQRALSDLSIEPNIVLKIEGVDYLFGSSPVKDYIRIGDAGLLIGNDWRIGGLREVGNNKTLIDSGTTSYTIRQQMNYDQGESSSISSITVGLVDKDQFVSKLISPGFLIDDILGRKCQVFVGFGTTSFSEDYLEVFKGYVTEVESRAGLIIFKINHPDTKKKINFFKNISTKLTVAMGALDNSATVETTTGFKSDISGVLSTYVVIDDEILKYTVTSGTGISVTRGQLGTLPTAHAVDAQVKTLYALTGNPLNLAMMMMMSGFGNDPVYENIPVQSFYKVGSGTELNDHGIYFQNINLSRDYGIRAGDKVTISGATNASNNFTDRLVKAVTQISGGYYIVVDGATLVYEVDSPAVMSFKTQYNVLDEGMKMTPDEVDIDQHEFIRDFFHPSTQMRFFLKEDISDGKEFIEKELYKPIACYTVPRKAKSSVGYTVGPVPGTKVKSITVDTVKDAKSASIKRTTARAFFNEVIYKYNESPVGDSGKFLKGYAVISETSKARIPGINQTFVVESLGLKTDLNADNIVQSESQRVIDRYQFASESVYVSSLLKHSVDVEIGDIVVLEGKGLQLTDIKSGSRAFVPRLFEVRNTEVNLKTGEVTYELLDTGLAATTRYGLMSPVSKIAGVVSQSQFVITYMDGYPSQFGDDEFRNWENVFQIGDGIKAIIRNSSYTVSEQVTISNTSNNTFTLATPATMTLTPGLVLEFDEYDFTTDKQKLIYAFMQDSATFNDGSNQYGMI